MTNRYPEAFDGDSYIESEIRRLVKLWEIKTIVETGTYEGKTTRALADIGPEVVTIEKDLSAWKLSEHLDEIPNVHRLLGDSDKMLKWLVPMVNRRMFFYLDAHWGAHSPLLDELEAIARAPQKPVIAIHDFFNPEHEEYGFDQWDIGSYRLELIEPALDKIYRPGGWVHHFNDSAQGRRRGIIYIEPKEGPDLNEALPGDS
jgi:hypothetical protein